MDDHERTQREDDRLDQLPEHESDEDVDTVMGGGVMSSGGTAVDRGTGTLGGTAQGERDDDHALGDDVDVPPIRDVGRDASGPVPPNTIPPPTRT